VPEHRVQFYDDNTTALAASVGRYAAEAVRAGDSVLIIATAEHRRAFARSAAELGADVERAAHAGRFVSLDAEHTLESFMVDGRPEWDRFVRVLDPVLRSLNAGGGRTRAYGEMVGVLWTDGRRAAAAQLEAFWNRVIDERALELFCAYPIDIFGEEFRSADIDALLCAHTHVVPAADTALRDAVARAMHEVVGHDIDVFAGAFDATRSAAWPPLPKGEAAILWLRDALPAYADEIVRRARHYYTAA
jgi:hypothetical protein